MSQDELVFRGLNTEECTSFIREVHKRAHEAGRLRDNAWMADIAMIAFDGDTLEWFDEQTPETQADWMLLRRDVIHKYGRNRSVPTPPAATEVQTSIVAPIALVPDPPARLSPAESSPISCYMKVIAPKAGYRGYVSQTFEDTNFGRCCTLTENLAEAIELSPSSFPTSFRLYKSDFSRDQETSKRVGVLHTRKEPWCGILTLCLPVYWQPPPPHLRGDIQPMQPPPVYSHHSAKGDERNDESFSLWNVDEMGRLSFRVGSTTVLTKTANGGLTLTFWERRMWDDEDDVYAAGLYLIRAD